MHVAAQPFSYVYIQGDKSVPFYIKVNGKMQPRYGKNYCIIPELNAGLINIEVLFQQNTLPSQKFTVDVPANGYSGYLLRKKDDSFELYELAKSDGPDPGK